MSNASPQLQRTDKLVNIQQEHNMTQARNHDRKTTGAALTLAAAAGLLLQGCGIATSKEVAASPVLAPVASTSVAQGIVMGGQQPVAGVTLQLYVVGTSYGGVASTLGSSVQSVASGNFTLPAFSCPSMNSLVYLLGTGGTPIGGSANLNLSLIAGLGACGSVGSTFINLNEITTVATVYALAGFMSGPTKIGAPASNTTGLTNAFAAINKVVDVTVGTTPGAALPTNGTLPVTEINALGNVLQNCVNSGGGSASDSTDGYTNGTTCGKLFFLTKSSATTPADVVTAAMLLAQNPALGGAAVTPTYVARLNDLQASSPAFSPALTVNSPPTDFTIGITYSGGGLSTPQTVATDSSGDIWITNRANNSVTELSNTGAAVSPAGGFTAGSMIVPWGLAIDQSGYVWVTNSGNNTVTKLSSTGTTGTVYAGNSLSTPKGVAIDGAGTVWIANSGSGASGTVSAFTNAGAILSGSPFSGGGIDAPTSIAVNPK